MRRGKYRAIPTYVDGIRFASKKEAARYEELCMLKRMGKITRLVLQPKFPFIINGIKVCEYRADFSYMENGNQIIEDVKGKITPVYRIKAKLMLACYGIKVYET